MPLEKTFVELQEQLSQCHEAISHLGFALDAVRPAPNELADGLRDKAPDLVDLSLVAIENAAICRRAATPPAQIAELGRSLVSTHADVNRLARKLWTTAGSHEAMTELFMLGRRQDQDWRGWTLGVRQAVDRCQGPLFAAMDSLTGCWQEILEHSTSSSISIKTTNVGPIGLPDQRAG